MKKIVEGIQKFQNEVFPKKKALFEQLAGGQKPSALVICCADSRVAMELVTQSEPGQLFFFRNAGNIVPPYGAAIGTVSATIEYAMVALQIPNIIVCGHSDCGAMKGVLHPEAVKTMPTVEQWLTHSESARRIVAESAKGAPEEEVHARLAHENVMAQLDHLRTHPSVAERLAKGEVALHGWYYDIPKGEVTAYDPEAGRFVPIAGKVPPAAVAARAPVKGSS